MSAILRTIDALKEIRVGDYVQFHGDRLGYVEKMLSNNIIQIRDDDGTLRPKRFQARKHLVAVIPKSGVSAIENRNLMQSPNPETNNTPVDEDNITSETQELISILKKHISGQTTVRILLILFFNT